MPIRDLEARFKPSVGLRELPGREQAGGSIVSGDAIHRVDIGFLLGLNHQVAPLDIGVIKVVGVGLKFSVSPAATALIVVPLRGVGRGTIRPVELVAPGERPLMGD